MSNRKNSNTARNKPKREWTPISVRPTPADIKRINDFFEKERDFDNLMAELTDGTVKVAIEYKETSNAYLASMWDTNKASRNANITVSTFHVSPYKALCALRVIIDRVQDGEWISLLDVSDQYNY